MNKKLLIALIFPFFGLTQIIETTNQEKSVSKALKAAYQLANQVNELAISMNNKVLKQVLDSSVNYEFSTNPDELYKFYKNSYTYDASGKNTSAYLWIYEFQDDTLGKTFHTYDASNKLISSISYSNWGAWEADSKKQYIYSGDRLTQIIDSTYNDATSAFRLYMTLDYTYGTNNAISEIYATLADFDGSNYGDQKIIFEYNLSNQLIYETILFESFTTLLFEEERTYDFLYDGQNNSSTIKESYDSATSAFTSDGKNDYFYDNAVNKSDLILPITQIYAGLFQIIPEENIGSYVNKLDSLHEISANLELSAKMIFYYNQKDIVGVKDLNKENIKIFPNPSTGELNFTNIKPNSSLQIVDVLGKTVLDIKNLNTSKIYLNSFTNGFYTILLKDENNSIFLQEKLVVNK
jgi:hypothetical protein